MTERLDGQVAIITGASRGIGLAIGLRAARDGAANLRVVQPIADADDHPRKLC